MNIPSVSDVYDAFFAADHQAEPSEVTIGLCDRIEPEPDPDGAVSADVAQVLTHECPAPLCTEQIEPDMLMCPRHWYQVPKPLRRAVWIAWDRGAGAGSPLTGPP